MEEARPAPVGAADVVVIGAGILGLAHAYAAARAGARVTVVEQDSHAVGASVRNFGLITVTGQARGAFWGLCRRSRDIWSRVCPQAAIPILQRSLAVIARRPQAARVLEAFLDTEMGEGCRLVSPLDAQIGALGVPVGSCSAVLLSPWELRIEARDALPLLSRWLKQIHGVRFFWGEAVRRIDSGRVETAQRHLTADRTIVCVGRTVTDFFPSLAARYGVTGCKLQMLRTQPFGRAMGPAVMSDLGIARYAGYQGLPGAQDLVSVLETEQPAYRRNGVHLIAVQSADGSLVLGDSHHYGDTLDPFSSEAVDQFVLTEFEAATGTAPPAVAERWTGTYAYAPGREWIHEEVEAGVHAVVVTTGAGMSAAFGIAEEVIAGIFGPERALRL